MSIDILRTVTLIYVYGLFLNYHLISVAGNCKTVTAMIDRQQTLISFEGEEFLVRKYVKTKPISLH